MGKGLVLAAALALAACQTAAKGSFCDLVHLEDVRPSKATVEAMTPEEREDRLALLRKGEKLCGWRP